MSLWDSLMGAVDSGLDTLGNTAGEIWDSAKDSAIQSITSKDEAPASVYRPETIPDQSVNTVPQPAAQMGDVWAQIKLPVMIGGGLLAAVVLYNTVKG